MASARTTPSATAPSPSDAEAPGARWWNSVPARTAARLAMPTTDKSIPPVSIATMMAIESRPSSGSVKLIDSKL